MVVALLTNTAWLDESLDMFRYLVVGLLDEQVGVVQVVPATVPEGEISAFGQRLVWRETPWKWLRRYRLGQLAGALQAMDVDVVHAPDAALWDGALRICRTLEVPLVVTVSDAQEIAHAQRLARAAGGVRVGFSVATVPLAKALRQAVGADMPGQTILPGVHVSAERPPTTSAEGGAACAVISGSGKYDAHYQALFEALQPIIQANRNVQFFLDAVGSDPHSLWQAARRLSLLSNMSLLPRALGHREMLLRADLLIQPQPLGRARPFTLKAMAAGVPVLAHADPWLDYLVPDTTAWVVERPDPQIWRSLIERAIQDPAQGRALGERARAWVGERHVAAKQVAQTLALYRRMTGEPFKFPQSEPVKA